jgi:hypothetical protein
MFFSLGGDYRDHMNCSEGPGMQEKSTWRMFGDEAQRALSYLYYWRLRSILLDFEN